MPLHGGAKKKAWSRKKTKAVKSTSDMIEESDVSFSKIQAFEISPPDDYHLVPEPHDSSTANMLSEDHPLHNHMTKLLDDFQKMSRAVDVLKFSSTVDKKDVAVIMTLLDAVDDTLTQMQSA
jgi:hypothetical protein